MLFNLNEFLLSISFALDFIEMDVLGNRSNHSKRVAYISLQIGKELGLSKTELFDLISLSILHDNGCIKEEGKQRDSVAEDEVKDVFVKNLKKEIWNATTYGRIKQENSIYHCKMGEENISFFPFYTNVSNVLLYHHENYNGTGFFGKTGEEIPLFSQIIRFADAIDNYKYLPEIGKEYSDILDMAECYSGILFAPEISAVFPKIAKREGFWMDLKESFIDLALRHQIPKLTLSITEKKLYEMTKLYSKLIDLKSPHTMMHSRQLVGKAFFMADYYKMEEAVKYKLAIAAGLHDIGKLAIGNEILDKPGKLTTKEYNIIKSHVYYSRISLSQITGFGEVTEWAANHHECLDGSGYPYGKEKEELDFNSRLLACLDIFQALTEERSYRQPDDSEAVRVLRSMASFQKLDSAIVEDIIACMKLKKFWEVANI